MTSRILSDFKTMHFGSFSFASILFLSSVCVVKSSEGKSNQFSNSSEIHILIHQSPLLLPTNNTFDSAIQDRKLQPRAIKRAGEFLTGPRVQRSKRGDWIDDLFSSESVNRTLLILKDKLLEHYGTKGKLIFVDSNF